jgi:hypothetical protein
MMLWLGRTMVVVTAVVGVFGVSLMVVPIVAGWFR